MTAEPSTTLSLGVLLVDHGSKIDSANQSLATLATEMSKQGRYRSVRHAHMELAAPDIAEGFRGLVSDGVSRIIVLPYFLAVGRHAGEDIPRLCRAAAEQSPGIQWTLAQPVGTSPAITAIVDERIDAALTVD